MPSFYLLITFSVAYLLYLARIINWEKPPGELHFWCWVTILLALFSVISNIKRFGRVVNDKNFQQSIHSISYLSGKKNWFIFFAISAVGIFGIAKYLLDYSNYVGAIGILYSIFTEDAGQLRTMAENIESVGTQLSYFSWLSAFILIIDLSTRKISKWWFLGVVLIVVLNSIFLDRTRPIWLIFTCALCYFLVRYHLYQRKSIAYVVLGVASFFITIFIAIGNLLGKGSGDDNYMTVGFPIWTQPIFMYITCSFPYLGRLIYYDAPCYYMPERVMYPLQKILAKAHLVDQPPSQILEFFSVPLLTNVGSFLEPFYQDGGRVFLLFGILLHTIFFDQVSFYLMKRISVFSVIAISTLCFIDFIAFFVPKISSTATWVILLFSFILFLTDKIFEKDSKVKKLSA